MKMMIAFAMLCAMCVSVHADELTVCGQVNGGIHHLSADLQCTHGIRLSLNSATLDMRGHAVICEITRPCVFLTGWGSRLIHGAVQAWQADAIIVTGQGGHQVWDVHIGFTDSSISVLSHYNLIANNVMASGYGSALLVAGSANWIANNVMHCVVPFFGACLDITGDSNAVTGNSVDSESDRPTIAGQPVVGVAGNRNWLANNRAYSSSVQLLHVSGKRNVFQGNNFGAPALVAQGGE